MRMLREVHIKQPVEVQVREGLLLARRSSTSAKQIHDKEGPLFFFFLWGPLWVWSVYIISWMAEGPACENKQKNRNYKIVSKKDKDVFTPSTFM